MGQIELPTFFKRRFNQKEFDVYVINAMKFWNGQSSNYREFEINVFNESISDYFHDKFNIRFHQDIDGHDIYLFTRFIEQNYEDKLKNFYNKNF